ncbi:alpha/beta-hydrolase family protein [Poseidonocella sp. HB161398]|uniref:alpha/beta hydrolase n=1 Tax=Poseidonocella sp. HB161398 TaxID=2320855 RepID=UPI00110910C9|nr:alpha/beta-hydrolase family protein [Poseidonocella sp. HB161398]
MADDRKRDELSIAGFPAWPLVTALLFLAASLTPSMIPRGWLVQGALSGMLAGLGYMIGRLLLLVWRSLGLTKLPGRLAWLILDAALLGALAVVALALWQQGVWQDDVRIRMDMPPAEEARTLRILGLALAVFLVLMLFGLGVQKLFDLARFRLDRVMPRGAANVLGFILVVLGMFFVTRDGLIDHFVTAMDESYEAAQQLFDPEQPAPADPMKTGSDASLVSWGATGRPGRNFIAQGVDAARISAFTGRPAKEPIRVYVGRAQDDDPEVRARIALAELIRQGAFDRRILIVASPTGTGWLDPGSFDAVEMMNDGDTATVAVQYSFMQSPLALIFETRSGLDQASALIRVMHDYWRDLPEATRPKFYIHGLSLGAWSSMYGVDAFRMVNDPIDGAFWAGPPFPSDMWNRATQNRDEGSPEILPVLDNGETVRFVSHFTSLDRDYSPWRRMRVIFLQYSTDAIVFYDPASTWRPSDWMREERAPDISPDFRFIPVVTQFQMAMDMAIAMSVPGGHGHAYYLADYVRPWAEITQPPNWSEAESARLVAFCDAEVQEGCAAR